MADRRLRPAAWDPCAPCWGLFGLRLPAVRWGARGRGAGTTGGRSCEEPLTRPCCGPLAEGQLRGPEHLAWARGPWAGVTVSGGIALLRGARSGKGPSRSPPVLTALLRARGRLPARALSGGQAVDAGGGAGPPCGGEGGRLPAVGAGRPRVCRLQTPEAGRVVDSPTPMLPWSRAPAWTKPPAARSLHEARCRPGTQGHETALRHWARGPWNRHVAAGKHGHSETRPQTDGDQGPVCRVLQLVPPPMGGAALPCARPWGRAGRRTWGSQTSFSNWRMHTRGTAGRPPPLRLLHTPWGQGQWDGLGRWAENVRQRSRERRPSSQGCVWPEGPGFWGETTVSPGVGTPHFGL